MNRFWSDGDEQTAELVKGSGAPGEDDLNFSVGIRVSLVTGRDPGYLWARLSALILGYGCVVPRYVARNHVLPKGSVMVAALKDGVAYCNKAFDSMTDAKGSQMVKLFNFDLAKLTVFSINTAHTDEHYGNMVTYLRLKGIVPPTSENQPAPAPK